MTDSVDYEKLECYAIKITCRRKINNYRNWKSGKVRKGGALAIAMANGNWFHCLSRYCHKVFSGVCLAILSGHVRKFSIGNILNQVEYTNIGNNLLEIAPHSHKNDNHKHFRSKKKCENLPVFINEQISARSESWFFFAKYFTNWVKCDIIVFKWWVRQEKSILKCKLRPTVRRIPCGYSCILIVLKVYFILSYRSARKKFHCKGDLFDGSHCLCHSEY